MELKFWKLLFCLSCICSCVFAQDDESMNKLKGFFTNIAAYNKNFTQEKVYLHLDNNGYFPNEKIWFKAYVFKASTLLPTDMSKVLYVELVTPDGAVLDRKRLPIINGRTYGEFDLDYTFITGYYEIRAYTRAMTNWDAAYYGYSRMIPVFEMPQDSVNFTNLSISDTNPLLKYFRRRKMPDPLTTDSALKTKKYILTFYPEGGHIERYSTVYRLPYRTRRPCRSFRFRQGQGQR